MNILDYIYNIEINKNLYLIFSLIIVFIILQIIFIETNFLNEIFSKEDEDTLYLNQELLDLIIQNGSFYTNEGKTYITDSYDSITDKLNEIYTTDEIQDIYDYIKYDISE